MSANGLRGWAVVSYLAAIACIGFGFYTMYTYGNADSYPKDYTGHIVGGDAYNYIIIGLRGLGWLVTGLIMSLIGAVSSIRAGQVEFTALLSRTNASVEALREQPLAQETTQAS